MALTCHRAARGGSAVPVGEWVERCQLPAPFDRLRVRMVGEQRIGDPGERPSGIPDPGRSSFRIRKSEMSSGVAIRKSPPRGRRIVSHQSAGQDCPAYSVRVYSARQGLHRFPIHPPGLARAGIGGGRDLRIGEGDDGVGPERRDFDSRPALGDGDKFFDG